MAGYSPAWEVLQEGGVAKDFCTRCKTLYKGRVEEAEKKDGRREFAAGDSLIGWTVRRSPGELTGLCRGSVRVHGLGNTFVARHSSGSISSASTLESFSPYLSSHILVLWTKIGEDTTSSSFFMTSSENGRDEKNVNANAKYRSIFIFSEIN